MGRVTVKLPSKPAKVLPARVPETLPEKPMLDLTETQVRDSAQGFTPADETPAQPARTPAKSTREPREKLDAFHPDTLEEAKQLVTAADEQWKQFERPGRYVVDTAGEGNYGSDVSRRENFAYGIKSARPAMEAEHPWLKNLPKLTQGKLEAAQAAGKGVEYTRLLNEAGRHIQKIKDAAEPVLSEFRPQLEQAARDVSEIDPELSQTLKDISAGKYSTMRNLPGFLRDKLNEAENAASFDKALGELSSGTEEEPGEDSGARE